MASDLRRAAMALLSAGLLLLGSGNAAHASRRVFLWFADGGLPPRPVNDICAGGRPPAFRCTLGPAASDCRQAIQALLDRWYADADVVFTYAEPADGPFDTVVLTSEGAWCNADDRTVSRSPLPMCSPVERGSVAIFRCGDDAKACATLVAKEQAHLLGLQHTASPTDVMNELGGTGHDGFEDQFNGTTSARCGALQNSRRLLIERAGAWPGGPKPDPGVPPAPVSPEAPDGAAADAGVADAAVMEPDGGGGAGGSGGEDDAAAGGGDAPAGRDAGATPRAKSGGCSYSGETGAPNTVAAGGFTAAFAAAAVLLLLGKRRRR